MKERRTLLVLTAVAVAVMLGVSAWGWTQVPDGAQVPVHWGIDGRADGYAPKTVGLLLFPALGLLIGLMLAALPAVEPRAANLRLSATAYRATGVAVLGLLVVVHAAAVLSAAGRMVDIGRLVTGAIGVLFVVVGNYLPKMRSTFTLGIRTPWTLTSEEAWTKTHRVGGRLFVALGAAMVALALGDVPGFVRFGTLLVGALAITAGLVAYSYLVWRSDPARRTLA